MPGIARIGDLYSDFDTQSSGSSNVFCDGLPVARQGDATTGHDCWPPALAESGSPTVFVNNLPAVRVGDGHSTHCCPHQGCHSGILLSGSTTVLVDS